MPSDNRRRSWVAIAALLVAIGALAFLAAFMFGRGGAYDDMPMRGWGFRYSGLGLLAWLFMAIVLGLGIGVAYSYLRRPGPAAPPPPPTALPPTPSAPTPPATLVAPAAPAPTTDTVAALRDLATLHGEGHLTDDEFAAAKRRILGL